MRLPRSILILALLGCTEQNRIIVHTATVDDPTKPDLGADIDIVHVPTQGYTQQKPGFFSVHGSNDWLFVWQDPRPDAKPPGPPATIDWGKEMLFVATAASPNAQRVDISRIIDTNSGLQVYVTETLGGTGCPVHADAPHPMDIVLFSTSSEDIHVHHDLVHAEECGPPPTAVALCRPTGAGLPGHDKIVAAPGQVIDCDATHSRASSGNIVDRSWQLAEAPPGSTTKLTVGNQGLGVTFALDAWGTYRLNLEVRDAARTGSAVAVVDVPPPDSGIPVELHWTAVDRNDDASMLPHVELHLADVANPNDDCGPTTAKPWCEVQVHGAVQQAVLHPEAGKTYRAYVSYQDYRLKGSPVACVRTFPKGRPSVAVCDELVRSPSSVWEAGSVKP